MKKLQTIKGAATIAISFLMMAGVTPAFADDDSTDVVDGNDPAQQQNTTDSNNDDAISTVTLTVEDRVYGNKVFNVEKGSRVGDVLENEGIRYPADKPGWIFMHYYLDGEVPTTADELIEQDDATAITLDEDKTIVAFYFEAITNIDLVLTQPSIGDEASKPNVSLTTEGAHCVLTDNGSWYDNSTAEREAFTGQFADNTRYSGKVELAADFGYFFDEQQPPVISITGSEKLLPELYLDDMFHGYSQHHAYQGLGVPFNIVFGTPDEDDATSDSTPASETTTTQTTNTNTAEHDSTEHVSNTGDANLIVAGVIGSAAMMICGIALLLRRRNIS